MIAAWPALFALGAGLVHLAIGAGVMSADGHVPTVVLLSALIALGAAELVWSILALRAERPPVPRLVAGAAVAGLVLSGLALGAGASPAACGAASLFGLAAAALVLRRRRSPQAPRRDGRTVAGVVLGAILVAGIATPALATTDAGLAVVYDDDGLPTHLGH